MMRKHTRSKLGCILLAMVMVFTVATGCARDAGGNIKIDSTKTQIRLSYDGAGLGTAWINEAMQKFETAFKDYPFEEGKKGVQFLPDYTRTNVNNLYDTILDTDFDVYIAEGWNYLKYAAGENGQARLYNLADVFNSPIVVGYENGEIVYEDDDAKLADKYSAEYNAYLNRGTAEEPKYYGIPYYLAGRGFVGNFDVWDEKYLYFPKDTNVTPSEILVELFEEKGTDYTEAEFAEKKAAYEAKLAELKASGITAGMVNANGELSGTTTKVGLSAGPDAEYGTVDDGLPATYDEFYLLCDWMVKQGVVPFLWGGANAYFDGPFQQLWRNYEGAARLTNYYQLNGTFDDIVKFEIDTTAEGGATVSQNFHMLFKEDGKTPQTESVTIEDGGRSRSQDWKYALQVGKYYAINFAYEIVAHKDTWTDTSCWDSTSWLEAQGKYITHGVVTDDKPYAMLAEGPWWQNEANDTFEIVAEATNGAKTRNTMNFGYFKLPNATVEKFADRKAGAKDVFVPSNNSYFTASPNIAGKPQETAVKMFLSFLNSDEMLSDFAKNTGILREISASYEISDEDKAAMSPWARKYVEYMSGCDIVAPYTNNAFVLENKNNFSDNMIQNFHTSFGGKSFSSLIAQKINENIAGGLTAQKYFEGMIFSYRNLFWGNDNANSGTGWLSGTTD